MKPPSETHKELGIAANLPIEINEPEELCAFCDKPDVFLKGLCPICFEDHYGD